MQVAPRNGLEEVNTFNNSQMIYNPCEFLHNISVYPDEGF
jgi:hypothetical protein